jgi:hypothetical protein
MEADIKEGNVMSIRRLTPVVAVAALALGSAAASALTVNYDLRKTRGLDAVVEDVT